MQFLEKAGLQCLWAQHRIERLCPADDQQVNSLSLLFFPPALPRPPQETVSDLPGAIGIKEMCLVQPFSCSYLGLCGSWGTACLARTQVMQRLGKNLFHPTKWQIGGSIHSREDCEYDTNGINTKIHYDNKSWFSWFSLRSGIWWQEIRFNFLIFFFLVRNVPVSNTFMLDMNSYTFWAEFCTKQSKAYRLLATNFEDDHILGSQEILLGKSLNSISFSTTLRTAVQLVPLFHVYVASGSIFIVN